MRFERGNINVGLETLSTRIEKMVRELRSYDEECVEYEDFEGRSYGIYCKPKVTRDELGKEETWDVLEGIANGKIDPQHYKIYLKDVELIMSVFDEELKDYAGKYVEFEGKYYKIPIKWISKEKKT